MTRFVTLLLAGFCFVATIHAQQYSPVNDKSSVKFSIKNFGINVSGSFKGLQGDIEFDKANPDKGAFNISIDAATVNTGNDSRDSHLREDDYFDVAKFPRISFKSEKIASKGSGFTVTGQLTMKGVSKTITIPFKAEPKEDGYLFEGSFQVNRKDFKVGGNSMVLGDNATITLSVFGKKK